ncbi:DUF6227 family protein [Streptomyces sp. H27-D2]|uniref:DUF6227 family protein n=1 Tax=Streptomyces sp. H27-D2 TaxID=3046304 RepID=UPI002DB8D215|nr:DUF6227 family protein [Streptomyces sp. H27-D2]MEC4020178.1 DUF6227 family protein [Streptomyces sp. H27-D2]
MGYRRTGAEEPEPRGGVTPAEHITALLTRAQNAFEFDEAVLSRLRLALMHQSELHSWRQRNEPPRPLRCSTHQHTFLLADGSSPVLWELQHDTVEDGHPQYELYTDKSALERAERRVHERMGGWHPGEAEAEEFGPGEELLIAIGPVATEREYVEDNSADHAWRVLRRAENTDRPGEDTSRLLRTARAHDIALITKPRSAACGNKVWCRLYEHAFLLADGVEVSLWELEHNLAPDEQLVCEVYLNEAAADQAADRRARALGVEL